MEDEMRKAHQQQMLM